jgi:hypothetical protein
MRAGESNPHSLSANRFSYPPRLSPPPKAFGVWTIPSPWPEDFRCRPSSLYTFPTRGLARDCRRPGRYGFPEFERFYSFSFPKGTPSKSAASTSFATPACRRSSRFRSLGQVMASRRYTLADVLAAVAASTSIRQVLEHLGLGAAARWHRWQGKPVLPQHQHPLRRTAAVQFAEFRSRFNRASSRERERPALRLNGWAIREWPAPDGSGPSIVQGRSFRVEGATAPQKAWTRTR